MGMCRIVLHNGQMMHLDADAIWVENGHLKLADKKDNGGQGMVAIFAPGVWAYYLWAKMEG
jgi:hypothetical protein